MTVVELAHDRKSEQMVVVACTVHEQVVPVAVDELQPEHFHDPRLSACFGAIQKLFAAGEPVRVASIAKTLEADGLLERMGGLDFFDNLHVEDVTPRQMPYWAKQIRDAYCRRRYHHLGEEIQAHAVSGTDPDDIEGEIANSLDAIRETRAHGQISMSTLIRQTFEEMRGDRPASPQTPSGFYQLDDLLQGGFEAGDLVVVAGRTSHGKSAFGNRLALEAGKHGHVHIVSTEIRAEQLAKNLLTIYTRVPRHKLRQGGRVTDVQKRALLEAAQFIGDKHFSVADPSQACDIGRIMARTHQIAGRTKLAMLVVDYIQNVSGVDHRGSRSREQEVAEVSRKLKRLAIQLKIPVIALSQLNRQIESRDSKIPTTADIRESDAIAHDADTIIVIDRPEARLKGDCPDEDKGMADIHVVKNRLGQLGKFKLAFIGECMTFTHQGPHL